MTEWLITILRMRIRWTVAKCSWRLDNQQKIKHVGFETFVVDSIQLNLLLFFLTLSPATSTLCLLFVSTLHFHLLLLLAERGKYERKESRNRSRHSTIRLGDYSVGEVWKKKFILSESREESDIWKGSKANRLLLTSDQCQTALYDQHHASATQSQIDRFNESIIGF